MQALAAFPTTKVSAGAICHLVGVDGVSDPAGARCRACRSSSGRWRSRPAARSGRRSRSGCSSDRSQRTASRACGQLAGLVDVERATWVVDVQEPAGEHRARAGGAVLPRRATSCGREPERSAYSAVPEPSATNRSVLPVVNPDDGRGEHLVATRGLRSSAAAPPVRGPAGPRRAVEAVEVEQLEQPVLAALDRQPWAARIGQQCRRGAAEIRCRWRSAAPGRSASSCEAPRSRPGRARARCRPSLVAAVERAVAGRHQDVGRARLEHRARATPDRRVAPAARARHDQLVPVRAQRVEHVLDPPGREASATRRDPGTAACRRRSRP